MSRSTEARNYDKFRIRYEVAVLEYSEMSDTVDRLSARLSYERAHYSDDHISIKKREKDLDHAEMRFEKAENRKSKAKHRLDEADQALTIRWNDEYNSLRSRFPPEMAEQIVSEANGTYPNSYYLDAANKEYDCDA